MFKKFTKRLSAITVVFMLALSTTPLANNNVLAASEDTLTIVHTNDMHGRLNQNLDGQTRLAALKNFIEEHKADLVLDAGDAIQGMPVSNISKGEYMLKAMVEIGYDAMTIGNHEFDFGQDNLMELKGKFDGSGDGQLRMLSSNVFKDGNPMFDSADTFIKNEKNISIIGVTTPETSTKTHPNNVIDIEFKDPFTQVKLELDKLSAVDTDLVIVLAHLGNDQDSKDSDRGDVLAKRISDLKYKHPVLVIDGHSHSEINPGVHYDNNVLYVQTGEYINNIGHVVINFDDFSKSVGKLVPTPDVPVGATTVLSAEVEADKAFEEIGNVPVIEDFKLYLESDRKYSRTQETALGNLIADSVMAYGKTTSKPPHIAVINGGGIRANLEPGLITVGDIIAVLPFGNMYSSIEVTGQQIIDMFEHSYRNDVVLDDDGKLLQNEENGTYFIGANAGFLHIAGAIVEYDPFAPTGEKVLQVYIDMPSKERISDNYVEIDPSGNYVLATNDFLAFGGDGFDMLSGVRVEGSGLDDVLIDFLKNKLVDFSQYEKQFPKTRILQKSFSDETIQHIIKMAEEVEEMDLEGYTEESLLILANVLDEVADYLDNEELYEHELRNLLDKLDEAIEGLTLIEAEKPVEPTPVKPEEKPTEPKPTPEVDATPKDDLPSTGSVSLAYPATILAGLGFMVKAVAKRKEE